MLARCPSCLRNFINLFCSLTCDPQQSGFMAALDFKPYLKAGQMGITSIAYAVAPTYADTMFNSCKDVQNPNSNQRAIGILCNSDSCTPKKWLKFLGSTKENDQVPFDIDYKITAEPYVYNATLPPLIPMNVTSFACSESVDNETSACSCQDCDSVCPPLPPHHTRKQCFIYAPFVDCLSFSMGVLFIVFTLCFGTGLIWKAVYSIDPNRDELLQPITINADIDPWVEATNASTLSDDMDVSAAGPKIHGSWEISCYDRLGAFVEKWLSGVFASWGRFCARRPIIVLLAGFSVCVVLSVGIVFFKVSIHLKFGSLS